MSQPTQKEFRIALIGNPNSGKSTVFNELTGLSQKTGNFPGVTVEKSSGKFQYNDLKSNTRIKFEVIDLPGTYSLFVKSPEELETLKALTLSADKPDMLVVVVDATNLRRSLVLCFQCKALGYKTLIALNMTDLVEESGFTINESELSLATGMPVVSISAKKRKGITQLKALLVHEAEVVNLSQNLEFTSQLLSVNSHWFKENSKYYSTIQNAQKNSEPIKNAAEWTHDWVKNCYTKIDSFIHRVQDKTKQTLSFERTRKLDYWLTHRIWGFPIFFLILLLLFQLIFSFATVPMDWIDGAFSKLSGWLSATLPESDLSSMLADGIVPGIGGVVMFVPQIAILFGIIAILEDTGYMARVSYLMDKLFRRFGLNGRSVIPLVSGVACAVPAVVSARTIKNTRERLITIMITPLMSCSARIPVYVLICGLVIPAKKWIGLFDYRALAMAALYLSGFFAALAAAYLFKKTVKETEKGFFMLEMPVYRWPKTSVVFHAILKSVKLFVWGAGRIIVSIAILLWATATYGPAERMKAVDLKYEQLVSATTVEADIAELERLKASEKLENSFIGILGKAIEPAIQPLGYDWKIGIGLITSFAAREVFIGSMATIYGISADDEDTDLLKERMVKETHSISGLPVYTFASGISLLLFYAFAIQCMSTIAVVKRETGTWKWPLIQLFYMSALAYVSAWLAFVVLS